jgi:hypothetical protein
VYEVFPARPPRHRLPQQTCMPQMPPNPRPEQMRSRRLNLSPLRRSPRRVVVSLNQNRSDNARNADRPHDSNKPPRGNLGPGHRAHRTRRTINQSETNHRFCHKNPLRPLPPSAPQNS